MFIIDFFDDEGEYANSLGPFPERPIPEQAVSAVLESIKKEGFLFKGFSWAIYDLKKLDLYSGKYSVDELKEMPVITDEAREIIQKSYIEETHHSGSVSLEK